MSDPLAISAVSAVLQYYFYNMFTSVSGAFGGAVAVSSRSPDLVQQAFNPSAAENQVNLFMHQVTYNQAWRNVGLPSLDVDGKTRLKNPPLALDLHYLLTVYGSDDWQAEGLLGYALMMLHENPVMTREDISYALNNMTGSNANMIPYLKGSTLADQIEMIKITPATLGKEELAWLWTALKADYRPTFPFQVSVVLIQPQRNNSLALPVLRRSLHANPIQPAQILAVQPPNGQVAAAVTDTVTVTGNFLGGVSRVWLSNPRYAVEFPVPVSNVTNTSFQFATSSQTTYPSGVPAGIYTLVAQFTDSTGSTVLGATNALPFALAPTLLAQTQPAIPAPPPPPHDPYPPPPAGTLQLSVQFSPNAWEGQDVSLSLGSTAPPTFYAMTAPALPFTGNANSSLDFQFPPGLPTGPLLARLTVDGVTSAVQVNWAVHPPVFTGPMVTVT